ncbi:MAG: ABC transporter ATP-binding protein/permease [Actinobacteria bacterium]|nr:ABC transporter ATP-binding protein/permease [Actinomycetota bacterium]
MTPRGDPRGELPEDPRSGLRVWLNRRHVLRLAAFGWAYRWQALGSMVAMLAVTATGLTGPYLLRLAIDKGIAGKDLSYLGWVAALYLLAGMLGAVFHGVQTYGVNWVGQRVIRDLRDRLFRHLTSLDIDYYSRQRAGWIISRLTNDIEALETLLVDGVAQLVVNSLTLTGAVIILFGMDWRLAVVTMAVMPVLLLGTAVFRVKAQKAYRRVRSAVADVTVSLQESLSGIRVIQAFRREERNMQAFSAVNDVNRKANLDTVYLSGVYFPSVEFLSAVSTGLILLYGGSRVADGDLTVGILAAFIGYLSSFFDPVESLSELYNTLQSSGAALEKIMSVLDTEPGDAELLGALTAGGIAGALACEDVSFSYGADSEEVLDGVTLSIPAGQRVSLVGPTGAGKSTLAKLFLRFYQPTSGRITVDGADLRDYDIRDYRRHVGYVPQEPYLFTGSVLDNIRLADPQADRAEAERPALELGVHDLFLALPAGYDTEVRERGLALSAGERQLVSFARAFFAKPAVLILDEATSSVDPGTEYRIEAALSRLLEGRTSLVIAHRLSTVENSDRILVMEDGRIVEDGDHHSLLAAGGPYARLYRSQLRSVEGPA